MIAAITIQPVAVVAGLVIRLDDAVPTCRRPALKPEGVEILLAERAGPANTDRLVRLLGCFRPILLERHHQIEEGAAEIPPWIGDTGSNRRIDDRRAKAGSHQQGGQILRVSRVDEALGIRFHHFECGEIQR